jgi:hypothetical protein
MEWRLYELEVEFENTGALVSVHRARECTAFTSHCLKDDMDGSVDCFWLMFYEILNWEKRILRMKEALSSEKDGAGKS